MLIPAFTSMDEYNIDFEGDPIKPMSWQFVEDLGYLQTKPELKGMLINPGSDNFFVESSLMIDIIFCDEF